MRALKIILIILMFDLLVTTLGYVITAEPFIDCLLIVSGIIMWFFLLFLIIYLFLDEFDVL